MSFNGKDSDWDNLGRQRNSSPIRGTPSSRLPISFAPNPQILGVNGNGNGIENENGSGSSGSGSGTYSFPTHKLKRSLKDESKIPLVVVACGSYSPITYLHLRMFEMGYDYIADSAQFEILGGYLSPVSDAYAKPGLAPWYHRVDMCALACQDSPWIMVDSWEPSQLSYIRTARVLDHFNEYLNGDSGGCLMSDGTRKPIRIVLLAGGDLIQSFAVPNLWKEEDLHYILGEFGCLIIERTGANVHDFLLTNDSLHIHRKNVWVVKQYIHNDISSTKIRLFVKRGMSIRYLLPDSVVSYIHENRLYLL